MATARNYISRPRYRFIDADLATSITHDSSSSSPSFELDESDLYNLPRSPGPRDRYAPNSWTCKKPSGAASSSSQPVNVPDWSKILREEYRENRRRGSLENDFFDDEVEDEDEGSLGGNGGRNRGWVPPHELAARMVSSFSVTLKGRDLSRVRNAIWAKTGFQD